MQNRNNFLDIIKLISSFFVVFIHVVFPGTFGDGVTAFSGFAVPLFFMVSGFFSTNSINNKNYKKIFSRIKSLCVILIISIIIYSVAYIIINGIGEYIKFFYIKDTYIKLLVFNNFENTFFTPLWFLPALIYTYAIVVLLLKLKMEKIIKLLPCLFIILVILEGFNTIRMNISSIFYNNFLVKGLPYFSLGYIIGNNKNIIENQIQKKNILCLVLLLSQIILFCALYIPLQGIFNISALTSLTISVLLFLLATTYKFEIKNNIASFFISKLSLYIYILHWLVHNLIANHINVNGWIYPFIILIITVVISSLLILIVHNKKIKVLISK